MMAYVTHRPYLEMMMPADLPFPWNQLFTSRARLELPTPFGRPRRVGLARYDFGGGRPDPDSFPFDDLVKATADALAAEGRDALTYGDQQGYRGLREWVCHKSKLLENDDIVPEQVLITSGASHALSLIADALAETGDDVVTEAPLFSGTLNVFRRHALRLHGVRIDNDGMDVSHLAEVLDGLRREGRRAKFIYTVPTFQNPVGVTMPLDRRIELLRLAREHSTVVIEDDAYGELRFDGERLPTLHLLDQDGIVMRVGTMSKTLGAGMRLGWAIANPVLLPYLMAFKGDGGTAPYTSRVAAYYMRAHFEEHCEELIRIYRGKRDAMLAGLRAGLGESTWWSVPAGGFFVWVRLPDDTYPLKLVDLAAEAGVAYVPGPAFFPDNSGAEYARLAFSYATLDEITEGIARFCSAVKAARR
jgi:2-aminoadipate transaminase